MTATLSTRLDIEALAGETELAVDYSYSRMTRELVIHAVFADIDGTEIDAWPYLTQRQKLVLEERCVGDYFDRMEAYYEERAAVRYEIVEDAPCR